jgi:hypothetical protein
MRDSNPDPNAATLTFTIRDSDAERIARAHAKSPLKSVTLTFTYTDGSRDTLAVGFTDQFSSN